MGTHAHPEVRLVRWGDLHTRPDHRKIEDGDVPMSPVSNWGVGSLGSCGVLVHGFGNALAAYAWAYAWAYARAYARACVRLSRLMHGLM